MAYPVWITTSGSLGIIPENNFYQFQFDAYNPGGGTLIFLHISGQLPPGVSLTKTGMLQGVPVVVGATNPVNRTYEFSIRAKNPTNQITDNTFSVTVSNIIPPQITPRTTGLGDYFDGSFFNLQLKATEVDPSVILTWTLTAGSLPKGLSLSPTGLISGFIYPLATEGNAGLTGYSNAPFNEFGYDNSAIYRDSIYKFSVQVSDGVSYDSLNYTLNVTARGNWTADDNLDYVSDNYLTIDHDNIYNPIVTTPPQSLPSVRGNSNFAFQFSAIDPNGDSYAFQLTSPGTVLYDQNGIDNQTFSYKTLYTTANLTVSPGDIITQTSASAISSGVVSSASTGNVVTIWASNITYNGGGSLVNTANYAFANTSAYLYKNAANTNMLVSSTNNIWIYSGSGAVGTVPGSGFDSNYFDETGAALPAGVVIDSSTGWLSGHIPSQTAATQTYELSIQAYKTANPNYISIPVTYNLTVIGDINNTITWTTPSDLGTLDNGAISEIGVAAIPYDSTKVLIYSIAPITNQSNRGYGVTNSSIASKLPQGLKLLPSGLLVGRVSFEYYTLDTTTTTIDGGSTTFDTSYTFTVLAEASDGSASSTQTFTLNVNNYNTKPYENLYLTALPTFDQRSTFLSIVNNKEIFPDNLLYRPTDPWFGRADDIRSLFLPGLDPSTLASYAEAIATNHYNKRIEFGNVLTARAVDENFNTKYEVVYIPLIDTETYNGNSPADVNYLDTLSFHGNVYPNSFENMQSVVSTALGYANQGALPNWMTAPQSNEKVLGFTRCIVLAYTIPNASALIAYRLKANGIVFNSIDFVADRYDLDNTLTTNYNISANIFVAGSTTTFDNIVRIGTTNYVVDYALSGTPFNTINNQTVATIRAQGGMDGVINFAAGQLLVFAQQESYIGSTSSNDGWLYPDGSIVPGYKEHQFNSSIVNQRGGIWMINIAGTDSNAIVTLSFVNSVELGNKIQVNLGKTYASRIVFYNPALQGTNTVPAYSIVNTNGTLPTPTIFDYSKTLFISNRDVYTLPAHSDNWVKFPKTNILQ